MTPETIQAHTSAFLDSAAPVQGAAENSALAFREIRDLLLEKVGPFCLFGGAARDIALHGRKAFPRDLDLVVKTGSRAKLRHTILPFGASLNAFQGFVMKHRETDFDIWRLEDTWGINKLKIERPTFEDLLKTSVFNIEAILIEFPSLKVYDGGFREGFEQRMLELNLSDNPMVELNLLRAAAFVKRFRLRIGPKLSSWIYGHRSLLEKPQVLLRIQDKYYKSRVVTEEELICTLGPHAKLGQAKP